MERFERPELEPNSTNEVLQEFLQRLTFLYMKIEADSPHRGEPTLSLPPLDILTARVAESSFKVFTDQTNYVKSHRASVYPSWSSPSIEGMGAEVYRVFFNAFSKKIYIDLNGPRWNDLRMRLDHERLYCEILKTLIFVLTTGTREELSHVAPPKLPPPFKPQAPSPRKMFLSDQEREDITLVDMKLPDDDDPTQAG